jgi:hypothetical protein
MADRTNGLNNIDLGSGRRGFRNRNLGLGQAGTVVDAEWANGIQEEIIRAIELAGLTPSDANREQLIQAIRRLAGGNVAGLSANATLTPDNAGMVYASAASGNVTLTLPLASAAGGAPFPLTIIRTDSTANTLTVQRAGADTVEGATSVAILAGQRLALRSNGVALWSVLTAVGGLQFGLGVAFSGGGGAAGFSGSWTVPAGVYRIFARAWGAGGGGGGSVANSAGGGGGGGAYAEGHYQVAPGTILTIQAGTGGAAGGTGANGSNGTASFITAPSGPVTGTLISAGGGGGGGGGASSGVVGVGGAGGTSAGGSFGPGGAVGQAGILIGTVYRGGLAGSAPLAGGGAYPGGTGLVFGSGGGGATTNVAAPGVGAGGLVTISW